jgi:hypothetical protein
MERGADGLQRLADRAAAAGGLKAKLAEPLADDAALLRQMKPSLIVARAKGQARTDLDPGQTAVSPTVPQLRKRPRDRGGPNPFLVMAVALAAGIAIAIAALAGVFLAMRSSFDPYSGPAQLIFAFEAVVIGGLGSLWGTLAGGIVLGVAQNIGAQLDPQWQIIAGHVVFLAILAARLVLAEISGRGGLRVILARA